MSSDWDAMVVVGRIARPHGLRGHVVINPETDFADERFAAGQVVYLEGPDGPVALAIATVRFQRGRPIVSFEGVESIEAAERLGRGELRVPLEWLPALPEGMYRHHDLIGCDVATVGGDPVGRVAAVEGGIGASVLVVRGRGREVLVPLAAEICVGIDIEGRRIVIAPPEGLLDLN